ncbi:hypothetical protein JCM5350_000803 [Sporobolomyces pararoseus]
MSGFAQLKSLQKKLDQLIDSASSVSFLALDEVRSPGDPIEPQDPKLAQISATLGQMIALVGGVRYVMTTALQFHVSSCIRVAIEVHVEETLREAGKPLSSLEIAKSSCIDPDKLARVLRLLAANHIFVEIEPGIFARNQRSSILDTGKSVRDILDDPNNTYAGTNGIAALIAHSTEEIFKASAFAPDALLEPRTSRSYSVPDAPFSLAYHGVDIWEHFAKNERLMKRFASGMSGFSKICGEGESTLAGYPWKDLPEDSTLVDVGGGVGHLCLTIGAAVSHLNFIVEDREEVVKSAPEVWNKAATPDLQSRVKFQAQNFFEPQQVKDASVFVLRAILHDWPDSESIQILNHLRDAATPTTKLVVIESTYHELSPPHSFPPINIWPYISDLQMLSALNAQERTEAQYESLGKKAGWKLVKTWKTGPQGSDGTWRHYEFNVV